MMQCDAVSDRSRISRPCMRMRIAGFLFSYVTHYHSLWPRVVKRRPFMCPVIVRRSLTLARPRDVALEDMTKLKELIDANTFAPVLQQMQQRAWLMHWGLYIFFNHENGRNLIVDTLFQDRHVTYMSTAPVKQGISASSYLPMFPNDTQPASSFH